MQQGCLAATLARRQHMTSQFYYFCAVVGRRSSTASRVPECESFFEKKHEEEPPEHNSTHRRSWARGRSPTVQGHTFFFGKFGRKFWFFLSQNIKNHA